MKSIASKVSEKYFLLGLIIINLFIRFWRLSDPSFAYFDESKFYLPAAREILNHGVDPLFEHPPLSKILFAFSINVFGDNSLGWRFFPVVFSVISVVLVYFLAKKLFNDRKVASLAAILFSLDFAWFTTGRLAIPETIFASFFLRSSYFWVRFVKDENKQRTNLFLGSIFFGLSLATKWSALLGVPIFAAIVIYKYKSKLKLAALSMLAFLTVSSSVYLASFGFFVAKNGPVALVSLHQEMFSYHSKAVSKIVGKNQKLQRQEGQYKAFFWPLNNIFSYRFEQSGEVIKSTVLFYNPVLLWGSLVVAGVTIFRFLKKKILSLESFFLVSLFLVFWLPFIFSPRIVYPYYWLAGIPFGTILLAKLLTERDKKNNQIVLGFVITTILLFIFYYPLLSNMPVKITYFRILTGTIGFD